MKGRGATMAFLTELGEVLHEEHFRILSLICGLENRVIGAEGGRPPLIRLNPRAAYIYNMRPVTMRHRGSFPEPGKMVEAPAGSQFWRWIHFDCNCGTDTAKDSSCSMPLSIRHNKIECEH